MPSAVERANAAYAARSWAVAVTAYAEANKDGQLPAVAGAGPYLGMLALPSILDGMRDRARAVLASGWRPSYAAGPTRDELAEVILAPVG